MPLQSWISFILVCLIFSSAPGAGVLSTISNATTKDIKITFYSILGLEIALITYLFLVGIGLGTIIASSILTFSIIKWFGACYLIYLGIQKFRESKSWILIENNSPVSNIRKSILAGILVNISNPKSIIFLVALLPQFINIEKPQFQQYAILGITMVFVDIAFHTIYALFAFRLKKYFFQPKKIKLLNKLFGTLFIGAGVLIAKANK